MASVPPSDSPPLPLTPDIVDRAKTPIDLPPPPEKGPTMSPIEPGDVKSIAEPERDAPSSPEDAPTREDMDREERANLEPTLVADNSADAPDRPDTDTSSDHDSDHDDHDSDHEGGGPDN